jgi:autotransporter-associated beta strand protein
LISLGAFRTHNDSMRSNKIGFFKIFAAAMAASAAGGAARGSVVSTLYWDSDTNAANNDAITGAGLGGNGIWNPGGDTNFWDGFSTTTDVQWNNSNNDDAVFLGTPANLSLGAAVSAGSLDFRSSGFGLIGAQELSLQSGMINVVTGNATVSAILVGSAGELKTGKGVLIQNNINNTYTGGTYVSAGVLAISFEALTPGDKAPLGIVPSSNLVPGSGLTLNATTLRIDSYFNPGPPAPATFGPTRRIDLGASGGTFDVAADTTLSLGDEGGGSRASGGVYSAAGGHLTKTGPGRVSVGKNTANAPHSYVGLTIRQGTWAIAQTDAVIGGTGGNPFGAQPPANPATAADARKYALVLDYNSAGGGAILQFRGYGFGGVPRSDINIGNTRPILIGAGGGTFDTNGSATSYGGTGGATNTGAFAGILGLSGSGSGTLIKTGDGEFFHYGDATYGHLTITRGSWAILNEHQLGGAASPIDVTLDDGADGAPGSQPATLRITQGGVNMLAAHTLTVGPGGGVICTDNAGVVWNGALTGTGTLTKGGYVGAIASPLIGDSSGSGSITFSTDSPGFSGPVVVKAGTLIAASAQKIGDDVSATNTLALDNGGAFGAAGSFTMNRAVTVGLLGGAIDTMGNDLTVSAGVSGAGTLTKRGNGTLHARRVRTGGLIISEGSVAISPDGGAEGTSIVNALGLDGVGDAWNTRLDVSNNDVIVRSTDGNRSGDAARIENQLKQGANFGDAGHFWTGNGIITSLGGNGSTGYTAVGFAINDFALLGGAQTGAIYSTFDGQDVGVNDVLLKYTYFGDADLDGAVTTNDYFQIDNGFLGGKAGWINGDFDYDGAVTTNDYFLIDNAFLGQGAALVPAALGSAAPLSGVTAVPEPTSLGVFAFAAAGLLGRARRRG